MTGFIVKVYSADDKALPLCSGPSCPVSSSTSPTSSPSPTQPAIAFENPSDNSEVPACLVVTGIGAVPDGQMEAVTIKEHDEDRYYIETKVDFDTSERWNATTTLGPRQRSLGRSQVRLAGCDRAGRPRQVRGEY